MTEEKGKAKRVPLTEEEKHERKNARQKEYAKRTNYAANSKYLKENTKRYVVTVILSTEADIYEHLEKQENKMGYIKRLIREDMERGVSNG